MSERYVCIIFVGVVESVPFIFEGHWPRKGEHSVGCHCVSMHRSAVHQHLAQQMDWRPDISELLGERRRQRIDYGDILDGFLCQWSGGR